MPDSSNPDRDEDDDKSLPIRRRTVLAGVATSVFGAGAIAARTTDSEPEETQAVAFGYGGTPITEPDASGGGALAVSALSTTASLSTAESEPNDDRTEATLVGTGTTVTGTLMGAEVDWFAVDLPAGADLDVTFEKDNDHGVVALVYYTPSGDFGDQIYASSTAPVTLTETAVESGRHFLQVVNVENGTAAYTLSTAPIEETPTPTEQTATATPTETTTVTPDQTYGQQNYGEYGYGGTN